MRALAVALLCLAPAPTALAAAYDVGPGRPYAKLEAVDDDLNPGDVVTVHDGAYGGDVRLERDGAPGNPIVVRGAPGPRPRLIGGTNTLEVAGYHDVVEHLDLRLPRRGATRRLRSPGRNKGVSRRRVLSALIFFPRGGSAHVARSLGRELPGHGWDVTILSGSTAGHGDARAFYRGLDPKVVDFDAPGVPMHPSYEDRPDAPDPVFAKLDEVAYERQVGTWGRALLRSGARHADVLHLHHLTPIHEAAARIAPGVPVVGHLHGTELLMLEEVLDGPPATWTHAAAWAGRMAAWAQRCERLVVLSHTQIERAEATLGIDPDRCVVLPNGFDPKAFYRRDLDRDAFWTERVGDPLADTAVVLSVSRFTAVKRLPLLIEAFAQARDRVGRRAALVIVGGHPGEHEGEHPRDAIERTGAQDVFLAGWHDHDVLPEFLSASDVLALASVREQFGQVLVEAMACAVPPVAVNRFGPTEIVDPAETGWLVEPDDRDDLAAALAEAIDDDAERLRRGQAARADARERFSWPALAGQLAETFDEVTAEARV